MNLIHNRLRLCFNSTLTKMIHRGKWDLMSAICLERKPVISRDMNDIERQFSGMLAQIELENSYKSDHEMRRKRDKLQAELIKSKSVDIDIDQTLKQTAQDFEDANVDEYNKFLFANRLTEADKKCDIHSLERKLDRHLLLLVLQKQWDRKVWVMPQGLRKDGETMLQTAERVLKETCGSKLAVNFYGNAPCGVYKFRYPKKFSESVQDCSVGAKVFFFKAQYVTGHIEQDRLTPNEFRWLGREELASNVPQEYYKTIEQFLIDE
ncbi:large ribosomal subunit protein mL46 [Periplaneta americana]|uniref:large ribosomal subunit protein mL46 n=1 Tax=Periplaneta americana TaxID=6978 RepID=UPI0037E8E0AF